MIYNAKISFLIVLEKSDKINIFDSFEKYISTVNYKLEWENHILLLKLHLPELIQQSYSLSGYFF